MVELILAPWKFNCRNVGGEIYIYTQHICIRFLSIFLGELYIQNMQVSTALFRETLHSTSIQTL